MAEISDTIVDATLTLLADRPYQDVTLLAIAQEAGVSLAELNRHFATRGAILAAFARRIDQEVLAAETSDMADETPRDRLFDILMSRLDALRPHREALRSLMRSARRDPQLALELNRLSMRSQAWMLAAAGLTATGLRGRIAVQSLVAAFAKVLSVFLKEEDVGMPRTMAALDQELKTLETRHSRLSRFFGPALSEGRAAHEAPTGWASAAPPPRPEPPVEVPPVGELPVEEPPVGEAPVDEAPVERPKPKAAGAATAKRAEGKPAARRSAAEPRTGKRTPKAKPDQSEP